jgi:HSP20 family molecular chaperone IbpA
MTYKRHNAVYPGEYSPLPFMRKEAIKELHRSQKSAHTYSSDVSEYPGFYKIKITAPGHKREDFILYINKTKLYITIMQTDIPAESEACSKEESGNNCIFQTIKLPSSIDTDFLHAEYKEGVLCMYFYKTNQASVRSLHHIVVY